MAIADDQDQYTLTPTNSVTQGPMSDYQQLLEQSGLDWSGAYSPAQQFRQFATTKFAPGATRSGFYGMQPELLQRYMLRAPMGLGGEAPAGMSFRDFMGAASSPGFGFMPYSGGLRGLAEQVGAMSALTGEQFLDVLDPQGAGYTGAPIAAGARESLGGLSPLQQYFYRTQYGTGRDAATNQMALATLLENQRLNTQPGGMMAQAVAQTLDELQQNLMARNPQANFLNWYLGRTGSPAEAPAT